MSNYNDNNNSNKDKPILPTMMDRAILEEVKRVVSARTADGMKDITVGRALFQKILSTAMNGSAHAQRHAFLLIERASAHERNEREEDYQFYLKYYRERQHAYQAYIQAGNDGKYFYQHPDDIFYDEDTGKVSCHGPVDKDTVLTLKNQIKKQEACLYQCVLEERLGKKDNNNASSAMLMYHHIEKCLPKRFYRDDIDLASIIMQYDHLTKRELLKQTYQAWQAAYINYPRGTLLPDAKMIQQYAKIAKQILPCKRYLEELQKKGDMDKIVSDDKEYYAIAQVLMNYYDCTAPDAIIHITVLINYDWTSQE